MLKNRKSVSFRITIFLILIIPGCSHAQPEEDILPAAYNTEQYLPMISAKKVGLVINHTSVLNYSNLLDSLISLKVNVRAVFTPEHGFKGTADAGAYVSNERYSNSDIPVISLYGKKKKPNAEDLKGIDIMVFDLQDVGVRFFTYLSTLHYIMEACAEQQIPLLVLDRPNPNGHYIDGPVLDSEYKSFIGLHPVPIVYGMTIGEYAQMINGEYWLADSVQCELTVIKCQHYTHSAFYNLPVSPSPNLRGMRAVYLYPSVALFEGTVVSEGRGTTFPFQMIGHPEYSDHTFSFIPQPMEGYSLNPKLKLINCFGMDLRGIPIDSLQYEKKIILSYLIDFYNDLNLGENFFTNYFDLLAGNHELRDQIIVGSTVEEIRQSWTEDIEAFKKIRVKYLLYPDFE